MNVLNSTSRFRGCHQLKLLKPSGRKETIPRDNAATRDSKCLARLILSIPLGRGNPGYLKSLGLARVGVIFRERYCMFQGASASVGVISVTFMRMVGAACPKSVDRTRGLMTPCSRPDLGP
ncbi:hypothetical protein SARC_13535 [Sphaeroforma arctica JP610]|uniref:Uncharacterized protein n=1 Tax=Sphaeroforma arctica JP610 TaxID=667725 RepID=A0A0L0FCV1_9EUKA|nr:hypothetical protein SARC_13535 [Sphaeroforma arctica JP610]KNC73908.1 hypothetical protein SARC_13535 [Sphaeroforma arctica JP610]|eukprot:XP_014147810.1 hypothetical protein SARC_13535 [Sphaeroforma arctica JP610]